MLRSLVLGLTVSLALAGPAAAQSVDELVSKNIEARGGLEKIKAVQTIKMTGKTTVGPGMEAPLTLEFKRPGKVRLEVTLQGMTLTQGYDGKAGWQINPFEGSKSAEPMSPEDLKEAEEQADMDGPLVDWKGKGHKVELVGKEKVEGTDTFKLKVTLKNGDVRYIFLDADSYLEIRGEEKRMVRGTEVEAEETIGDYKEVGGILFPYSIETGAKGHPEKQKITLEKIELNVPTDDSRFTMPAKTEAPPEKKPADKK